MNRVDINATLYLHYLNQGAVGRWRYVHVERARRYDRPAHERDRVPNPRIVMDVVDLSEDTAHAFYADRVSTTVDPMTGEVYDLAALFQHAGLSPGVVAAGTQFSVKRVRTVEHDLDFIGPGGGLDGFHFHVPPPFRLALDLSDRPKNDARSQGVPPAYGFSVGDVFYDSVHARRLAWADALRYIHQAVQVVDATPDQPVAPMTVRPGTVTVDIRPVRHGAMQAPERVHMSQAALVDFLRTGRR